MPEGDTVWLTAQRLNKALAGRALTISDFRVPTLANVDLRGRMVTAVLARGKHILARVDDDLTVHSHLRMDGSWYISAAAGPPARRHPWHTIRVLLGNAEWVATGFRVHDLRVVPRADESQLVGHLGPDLLGADWDAERALANLLSAPDVAVAEALLDQRNLAGIGNLYKSEALFIEGLDPWTPVGSIPDLRNLIATARRLMLANRSHPEQSTTGLTGRGHDHWVYGRAGEPCLRCRTPIKGRQQGAPPSERTTYWCPTCQPPAASSPR